MAQETIACPVCGTEQSVDPSNVNQCPECKAWHTGSGDTLVIVTEEQPGDA